MKALPFITILTVGIIIGYYLNSFMIQNESSIPQLDLNDLPNQELLPNLQQSLTKNSDPKTSNKQKTDQKSKTELSSDNQIDEGLASTQCKDLAHKYTALKTKYHQTQVRTQRLSERLESLNKSEVTDKQLTALVTPDFEDNIVNFNGSMRNKIVDFHQAPEDLDWGYTMKNYISDFIITHYNATDVQIVSVLCKTQTCELLVLQHVDDSWNKIFQDMVEQPWWQFHSSNSRSGNYAGSKTGLAIYSFLVE